MKRPDSQNNQPPSESPVVSVGGDVKGNIIVGNDNQVTVQQGVAPGFLQKINRQQWIGFGIVLFAIFAVGLALYFALRQKQKEVMTGEFRIAVASFTEQSSGLPDKAGYTIGDGIYQRLDDDLKEITVGPKVEIWGPDRIGAVPGKTPEELAKNAASLAKEIHAYMVIYGSIEMVDGMMHVTPEFYLDTQGFSEGSEIIGQYEFGSLSTMNSPGWEYKFNKLIQTRSDVISSMATGLSYFAVMDYKSALETFQQIDKIKGWDDAEGQKVVYALTGFAAGKLGDYDLAESMLNQSLGIDPEYARPYIGLANVAYMRSLQPFQESRTPTDIDFPMLQQCNSLLEEARQAKNKPPLAEVETKIHFAQGQCSMMITYSGHANSYDAAMNEFEQVLAAYGDGKNNRVQELAGEAHARQALIYSLTGKPGEAAASYQKAANVLRSISPKRAKLYQDRANEILGMTPTP